MVVEIDRRGFFRHEDFLVQPLCERRRRAGVFIVDSSIVGKLFSIFQTDEVEIITLIQVFVQRWGDDVIGRTDDRGKVFD